MEAPLRHLTEPTRRVRFVLLPVPGDPAASRQAGDSPPPPARLDLPILPASPPRPPAPLRPSTPTGTYANLVKQAKSKQKILDKMEEAGLTKPVQRERTFQVRAGACDTSFGADSAELQRH